MFRYIIPAAATCLLFSGGIAAALTADQAVAEFQDMGFEFIEVQDGIDQLKIEAVKGTQQLEVIYDKSSGRILKQEQERADADDIGRTGVQIRQRNRNFVDVTFSPAPDTAVDIDQIVSDLQAQGYDYIEIKRGPTQTKVEAIKGNQELEIVYDNATGDELKRETGIADGEDVGRTGIEIETENRDFVDDRRRADRDDDHDNSGPGSHDDDDDHDDNSGSGSHDDDDDDDDNSGSGSSNSGSGSDDSDDD